MRCLALLALFASTAAAAAPPLAMEELAPGVFVYQGAVADMNREAAARGGVANIGFVLGERCVAVIDTGLTRAIGKSLLAAIRARSERPVCYVINTHAHIDHVFGNSAFADSGARFVGHRRLGAALGARARTYINFLARELDETAEVVPPDIAVAEQMELDLGGRVLKLRALPTGHTDHDLIVEDSLTGTLWLSDVLFTEHMPALDGSIVGWIAVLRQLRDESPRLVIPGHGRAPAAWPAALERQLAYLERIAVEVRAAIRNRLTIQQAVDTVAVDEMSSWSMAELFHRRNVTAAYAELEWEE